MAIIVCNCQHCDAQKFQTRSCVHYTILSVVKLDLFIRTLLLDRILALENYTYVSRTSCSKCFSIVIVQATIDYSASVWGTKFFFLYKRGAIQSLSVFSWCWEVHPYSRSVWRHGLDTA